MAKAWAKEHGLDLHAGDVTDSEAQKENVDTIRDGLKNGGVALVGGRAARGHFTDEGPRRW